MIFKILVLIQTVTVSLMSAANYLDEQEKDGLPINTPIRAIQLFPPHRDKSAKNNLGN